MTAVAPASSDAARSHDPRTHEPLIIVGAMRSGTTMLRLMLNSHPRIHMLGEFEESVKFLDQGGQTDPARLRERLLKDRPFIDKRLEIDESLDADGLIRSFMDQAAARTDRPVIGFTIHRFLDRALRLWPAARVIHIVRDPRDAALSAVKMGWVGSVWHGCEHWLEAEETYERDKRAVAPGRLVEMRYEELIAEPQRVLGRCCDMVGVPWDPAMLEFHRTSTYEPLDPARASKWRRTLSRRQLGLIQGRCAQAMQRRGYELEDPPGAIVPGPLGRMRLHAEHRVQRVRFSVRRYGPLLAMGRIVRRRVRLPEAIDRRIRERAHAIERAHLQ